MTLRQRLARRLRFLADRVDDDGAMVDTGMNFTFEDRVGIRVRHDGRGCPMWYRRADYDLAHTESDTEHVQADWVNATAQRVGGIRP